MLTRLLLITCLSLWTKFCVAEVSNSLFENFYDINARSLQDLRDQVKSIGPKFNHTDTWAIFRWDLYTEYRTTWQKNQCKLVPENMEIIAEVTLPRWQNINVNLKPIQIWWKNYFDFVKQHEQAHLDNVIIAAKEFELALIKATPAENCHLAKENFLSEKHKFLQRVSEQDKILDIQAKKLFFSNKELFLPLKDGLSVSFKSGLMNSYISL